MTFDFFQVTVYFLMLIPVTGLHVYARRADHVLCVFSAKKNRPRMFTLPVTGEGWKDVKNVVTASGAVFGRTIALQVNFLLL